MVGPALGLAWLSCIGCDHVSAVAALCLAMGINAGTYAGFQVGNGMDGIGVVGLIVGGAAFIFKARDTKKKFDSFFGKSC